MDRHSTLVLRHGLLSLALLLLLAGCSDTSFLGSRYDNFTAYYNTFYNARQAFDRGITALEKEDQPVDRNLYLPLFTSPGQAASSKDFEDAIKKCADVLRSHPNSKWVDDALLLIGKSYFYQQNYVGAEQKFQEVVSLGSPLQDEARFWLARTLIASGAYDEATEHLTLSLSREGLSPRWEPMLRLALGELFVKRRDWEGAAEQLATGLEGVRDRDLGARAQFLLGQVLETRGAYEEAIEAFERVQRYKPLYELSYAAQISAIRVQGLHSNAEAALRELRRMERDDKNYSYRYELAYLRARIYQEQDRADDALALYDEILYDADANIANLRGHVHYALGELFRDQYEDFVLAAAYFDTARTALRSGTPARGAAGAGGAASSDVLYAPAAITDGEEQATMFKSFAEVYGEVARMDSLLHLGRLDDEAFAAKIMEIREQRAKEQAEQDRLMAQQQAMERFQAGATATGVQESRSTGSAAAQANSTAGFLFHKDPIRVQEGRLSFISRWGERPLVPNWRRMNAVAAMAAEMQGPGARSVEQARTDTPSDVAAHLPMVDYSDVPRDSVAQAAMRAERAMARYELANVLFLSMSRPDTAAAWYRMVIEEDGDQPVAQRAYYALAEVQRALGDSLTANRLYQQVLQAYPESDFADRVREHLGLPPQTAVVTDTLALAEEAYGQAYTRWRRGFYSDALDRMVTVAARYPETEVAPRALLAASAIYLEWASRDSLDLFGPLPLEVPDSLLFGSELFERPQVPPPAAEAQPAVEPAQPDSASRAPGVDTLQVAAGPESLGADSLDIPLSQGADLPAAPDSTMPVDVMAAEVVTADTVADTTLLASSAPPPGVSDSSIVDLVAGADTSAAADTLAHEPAPGLIASTVSDAIYLQTLYDSIKRKFPQSPYAERADHLLTALEERRSLQEAAADSMLADSTLAGPALVDSMLADSSLTMPDSTGLQVSPVVTEQDTTTPGADSTAAVDAGAAPSAARTAVDERAMIDDAVLPGDRTATPDSLDGGTQENGGGKGTDVDARLAPAVREALARERQPAAGPPQGTAAAFLAEQNPALFGDSGVDWTAGGWTIIIGSGSDRTRMEQMMQGFRYQGFRADMLVDQVGGASRYRVVVGQFEGESDARTALSTYGDRLPGDVEVYRIRVE